MIVDSMFSEPKTENCYSDLWNNLDSMCILICLQVCFHSAMKHENGVSNVVWLSQSCENLQFALRKPSFPLLAMKIIIL